MTALKAGLLIYTGALWLPGLFCLWRMPRCPRSGAPAPPRRVSVIVPARDEERRIRPLLESLSRQRRTAEEILVVDDGSTDRTAALAGALGARVIRAPARPEGWIGKTWACWTGAEASTGDFLVFLDADTELADDGLARLLAAHAARGGLVSVQPYHAVRRPYEQLSAFCNAVIMGSLGAFTPLGDLLPAKGTFGPCLAVTREDYLRCGGHVAVRDRVVEDMALGENARRRGLAVACLAGRGTVSFRMYPDGFRDMVEGWSKGMAPGAGGSAPLARALMIAWLIGSTSSVITLGLGLAKLLPGSARDVPFAVATLACYALYAAQLLWILLRIGSFSPLTALLFPLPLAFFHGVFARSAWLAKVRRVVTWRGRRIAIPRRRSR